MPTKSTVRADLNHLRKLNKSIRLIQATINEESGDSLSKELTQLSCKRDKIINKYRAAIDALSPEESLIFTLYYQQGLTQSQVAAKTNYCKSSVTKHLSAILDKLK